MFNQPVIPAQAGIYNVNSVDPRAKPEDDIKRSMTKEKKSSFETAFGELEKIVEELEGGEIKLDDSLKKFERGLELASLCRGRLKEVENKVREIKEKFKDSL